MYLRRRTHCNDVVFYRFIKKIFSVLNGSSSHIYKNKRSYTRMCVILSTNYTNFYSALVQTKNAHHVRVEIDHEIISTVILHPSAESFKKGRKYMHELLVNCLFKLAQEK